jgi:hypothetical protein
MIRARSTSRAAFVMAAFSLVEHETQVILAKHAEDHLAFRPHFRIHPESETIDPQVQTLLQIRAGNNWYA